MSVHPAGGMQVEKVLDDLIYRLANVDTTPEIRAALVEAKRLKSVTTRWGAIPPPPDARREMLARVMDLIASVNGGPADAAAEQARSPGLHHRSSGMQGLRQPQGSGAPGAMRQSPQGGAPTPARQAQAAAQSRHPQASGRASRQSETPTFNHRRAPASTRPTSPPPADSRSGRATPVGDAAIPREALPSLFEIDAEALVESALSPTAPPPAQPPTSSPRPPGVSAAPAPSQGAAGSGRRPPPLRRPTPLATAATLASLPAGVPTPPAAPNTGIARSPSTSSQQAIPARSAAPPGRPMPSRAGLPPPRVPQDRPPPSARRPTKPPPPKALLPSAESSDRGEALTGAPPPGSPPSAPPSRPLTLRPPGADGAQPVEPNPSAQMALGQGSFGVPANLASALSPPRLPAMSTRRETPTHPQPFTRTQSALPAVDRPPVPIRAPVGARGEGLDGLSTSISSAKRRALEGIRPRGESVRVSQPPVRPSQRPRPTELSVEVAEGINVVRPQATHWQPHPFAAGASLKLLYHNEKDGAYTALVRLAANAKFPARKHVEPEEMLMLNGSALVGSVEMHAGDYARALAGSSHPPIFTPSGCTFLISGSEHDELGDAGPEQGTEPRSAGGPDHEGG